MIIRFQFFDQSDFESQSHWFGKLKSKLRECKTARVFISDKNHIEYWNVVYKPNTKEFQNLVHVKYLQCLSETNLLFDAAENTLLCGVNQEVKRISVLDNTIRSNRAGSNSIRMVKYNKYLIIGTHCGDIEIRNWKSNKLITKLKGHENSVFKLFVNERIRELTSCASDGTIRTWNLKTFKKIVTIQNDNMHTRSFCFLDRAKIILAEPSFGPVKCWDLRRGCVLNEFEFPELDCTAANPIYSLELKLLLFIRTSSVMAYKLQTCEKIKSFVPYFDIKNPFKKHNSRLAFLDTNQSQVLVGDDSGNLFVIDLIKKQVIWKTENTKFMNVTNILVQ